MFRGCTFEEQQVNSKNDGGLYREIFRKDGILWGCEMTVTNDTFTIQPGELVMSGRVIPVDGATQIPFTGPIQNGYGQVVLTIDLSKTATKEAFDQVEASVVYSTTSLFPELTQGEINTSNGDMVYQQELAVVSIAGGDITGITRQIGGAEIDAEKLGGQPPEYYAKKSDLTAEAYTIPNQENLQFTRGQVRRIGNLVFVNYGCDYSGGDGILNVVAVGTLKTGFRPAVDISVPATAIKADGTFFYTDLKVQTNGQIITNYPTMNHSASKLRASFWFPVD